jgi:hypothetical protein
VRHIRFSGVLRLRSELDFREDPFWLVVDIALHSLDVGQTLLGRADALREGLHNLAIPLGLPGPLVHLLLGRKHKGFLAGRVLEDGRQARIICNLRLDLLGPLVPSCGLGLLDDLEAVLGEGLGGLAVDGRLGDLLELVERRGVVVEQRGARRRVCEEACETRGGAGLEELAGLDAGEEPCSCSHGCGTAACGVADSMGKGTSDAVNVRAAVAPAKRCGEDPCPSGHPGRLCHRVSTAATTPLTPTTLPVERHHLLCTRCQPASTSIRVYSAYTILSIVTRARASAWQPATSAAMRSIFYNFLSLATLATALAIETSSAKATGDWDDKQPDTIFNGQTVPPMIELTQHNLDTEISKGNWYDNHNYEKYAY